MSKRHVVVAALLGMLVALPCCADSPRVGLIHLDGIVHPITADYIADGLRQAADRGDAAVIIELNTPGGLDTAMREMISAILASHTPVIVWVGPSGSRAASAGFLILLSADVAAMAMGTNTGAAHPVLMSGQEMTDTMKKKVENDSTAYLRSFATRRGRNPDMAVTGITDSRSFSETEMLQNKMIDLIANSPAELAQKLDGRTIQRFAGESVTLHLVGAKIEPIEMSARQDFLAKVTEPNIALILMAVGILGIFAEFSHPGLIVPGVAGAISLILGLFAITLLPINLTGALLILLALSLFVLEAKFMSHGVLAVGGMVAMVLGAVILIDSPVPEMRIRLLTALSVALPLGAITVFLLRLAMLSRSAKVVTGAAGMLGEVAAAHEDFTQQGSAYRGPVFVQGEIWQAISAVPVVRGEHLRVRAVEGLHLRVEHASSKAA